MKSLLLIVVILGLLAPTLGAQESEVSPSRFTFQGTFGSLDGDPIAGALLGLRFGSGNPWNLGFDLEGGLGLEEPRDLIVTAQVVVDWSLADLLVLDETLGLWVGARAGVLLESDVVRSGSTTVTNELYPALGVFAQGAWYVSPGFAFNTTLSIEGISFFRATLGLGILVHL